MKKIFSIISAGIALLVAASCSMKEELVVLDPALCTPPVVESYDQTDDGIAVKYTPGTINVKAPAYHYLVMTKLGGTEVSVPLNSVDKDGVLTLTGEALSRTLVSLGCADGDVVDLEMVVRISPQQKQSGNHGGYADSATKIPVSGFTVVIPKGSPYGDYTEVSTWSLIGAMSAYGINWDGDLQMWTNGTGHVAAHVTLKAGDEVKFRKDQAWDVNFGGDFKALDAEFEVTQGGPNMVITQDGVYDLYLYPESGKAMISAAFDPYPEYTESSTWSIIGSIASFDSAGWGKDYPMITDGAVHVALGLVLGEGDEFKFRKDADWTVNFGGDFAELGAEFGVTQDGPNIKPGLKGAYDLFLNEGAATAWITDACGLKVSTKITGDEPGPEPQPVTGWNIIGLNGDWENDVLATQKGNVWTATITASEDTEFKWRKDGAWDENYGGTMVALGEPFEAVAGGDNIKVAAGVYTVVLDLDAMTITVSSANVFSLIGEINGTSWDTDFDLTENNGVWSSEVVKIAGGFKIRHNYSWADTDTYGAASSTFVAKPGETFVAAQPGENITLEAPGDYKVIFNPATLEVTINSVAFPEHLYMIGEEFGGWDWNSDGVVEMTPVVYQPDWGDGCNKSEAQFWAVRYISAGKGFKFCSQRAWNGDFWGLTTNEGFTESGGNCVVDQDGIYLIHVDLKREIVHVEPARVYGIGNCFGGWDAEMPGALFQADGKVLKATTQGEGELRMYVASSIANSDWWTREFIFFEDGVIDYRGDDEGQGDQGRVNVKKDQEIVLDFNAGHGEIKGEGSEPEPPKSMFMIGEQFGNWDWNSDGIVELVPVWGTETYFWCTRWFDASKGFKFCGVREWNGDFTGAGEVGYTVDGGNCWLPGNGLYTVLVNAADKAVEIYPAEVYGLGDAVFTGGWDYDSAQKFNVEGDKFVLTTSGAGELRLASKVQPSAPIDGVTTPNGWIDWWKTEFIFFEDGKIDYRGAGPDQARRQVEAGQTITIDFNAGTATISGGDVPPVAGGITIDGDMSDWEGVTDQVISEKEVPVYALFKVTNDDEFIYFYSKRDNRDAIWNRGGYIYYDIDADNNVETGVDKEIPGLEMWLYFFPFDDHKIASDIGNGSAYPSKDVFNSFKFAGAIADDFVEIEAQLSLADAGVKKGDVIAVYTWSNKSGDDLKKTPITYTVK